jgi:hypothetical protein
LGIWYSVFGAPMVDPFIDFIGFGPCRKFIVFLWHAGVPNNQTKIEPWGAQAFEKSLRVFAKWGPSGGPRVRGQGLNETRNKERGTVRTDLTRHGPMAWRIGTLEEVSHKIYVMGILFSCP